MNSLHASSSDNLCMIQTSEYSFSERAMPGDDQLEVAYRQLWLYAMRHYPQMPRDPKRKERLARSASATANERVVCDMGRLARRLGFDSGKIQELIGQAPDRLIARNALIQARDPEAFEHDSPTVDSIVDQIIDCFDMLRPKGVVSAPPISVSRSVPRKFRSGHPTLKDLMHDRSLLFLDNIHAATAPGRVTTAFVRRCVYLAFFGSQPGEIHHHRDPLQHMCNSSDGFRQHTQISGSISPLMHVNHGGPQSHTAVGPVAKRRASQADLGRIQQEARFQESTSQTAESTYLQMRSEDITQQPQQQTRSTMAIIATEGTINATGDPCIQKGRDLHCEAMEGISDIGVTIGATNNMYQLENDQIALSPKGSLLKSSYTGKINIVFYVYDEHSHWNISAVLRVNPSEPNSVSEFRRAVQRYKQRGITLCDMKMRSVSISSCLVAAMADGQNVLLLFPPGTRQLCQSPAIPSGLPVPDIS
ncbi:hypothetical protein BDV38DRAFT_297022 [Aspergillus pseudotamarii]|uniref:Uncharacterized protein n=1 Tax=Aspergillus pseudotamarii TaxID=132259 RepID=A0A5N6SCJ4_ASPPS|nr:uncharacterized protein BDV38DRAFT_297022 [Aspergillus pseudotamarii]KAE8132438.1 hypothetical protein BDV38DRAFT_297022 [Aspergillus pseudotamarii]